MSGEGGHFPTEQRTHPIQPSSIETYNAFHKVTRSHSFCLGHRVFGHESKCAHLHGHNLRVEFVCWADTLRLDSVGRVLDFAEIGSRLCQWLEREWDHRFLVYSKDPLAGQLKLLDDHVVIVPFNPTSENIAEHLVTSVAPAQLQGTGVTCVEVRVWETDKCMASYERYPVSVRRY